jgi:hypothetical protein
MYKPSIKLVSIATAAGLGLAALPVTSASAASDKCVLAITPLGFNQYHVTVGCTIPNGFITSHYIRLWGSDSFFDDLLYETPGTSFTVLGHVLNEDIGTDEIYATADLVDNGGHQHHVTSNEVEGDY